MIQNWAFSSASDFPTIKCSFLMLGSIMVLAGYYARIGALLLAVFLVLATYYFHPFWKTPEDQNQMAHFMKNLGLIVAMLFIIANGSGAGSLDARKK